MYQSNKHGLMLISLLAVPFLLVLCSESPPSDVSQAFDLSDPEKRIQIILRVQDLFYFNADFEKHLERHVGEEFQTLDQISLSRLMDSFIEDKILLKAALNSDVSVSWQEQKQYLSSVSNESFSNGEERLLDEAETQSLLDRFLIEKYIFEQVKYIDVEQEEIGDYYELNKREFLQPERLAVSQILLDTEEKAVEVLDQLNNSSELEFQQKAREVSSGVEASKGGYLGIFELNQLPAEMEKVVFALREGEISQVVESAYGFHIFRVDKKFEPELEILEKVSAEIRMKILDQKIKQFVSAHLLELKDNMDWEFYPNNLSFPYQRNSNE